MCSLTTSTYHCSHRHKKYWTYCAVVATQKENPKYAQAKCCQGPDRVREEKVEVLKKDCDTCRKKEKTAKAAKAAEEKAAKASKGGWLQKLMSRSRV